MEQKIDQAVIKLFDLDEKSAAIVTGSLDFAKKLNFIRTYAFEQASNEGEDIRRRRLQGGVPGQH